MVRRSTFARLSRRASPGHSVQWAHPAGRHRRGGGAEDERCARSGDVRDQARDWPADAALCTLEPPATWASTRRLDRSPVWSRRAGTHSMTRPVRTRWSV